MTADCSSFVREECGELISCYRSGGGGQRRELNVLKRLRVSGALLILLWKYEHLAVWTSAEKDDSKDRYILKPRSHRQRFFRFMSLDSVLRDACGRSYCCRSNVIGRLHVWTITNYISSPVKLRYHSNLTRN